MKDRRSYIAFLVLVFAVLFALVTAASAETRGDHRQRLYYGSTIEIDGVTYARKPNITTVLLMGIDKDSTYEVIDGYRGMGQADFLRLIVINDDDDTVTQIPIDRDTIAEVKYLNNMGEVMTVRKTQICLSHAFGDGAEWSCKLTAEAVSNFLLGTEIDLYAALDLDGISVLNDWAGGVEVTLEEDFSDADPSMTPGKTIVLKGDQAEIYVRSRRMASLDVHTNESRMNRQQNYIRVLTEKLQKAFSGSKSSAGGLYDELEKYMCTDMRRGRVINLVWAAKDYENRTAAIEGEHMVVDGHMAFYADEASVRDIITTYIYTPIE